jgi:excisionase family DNA binding protein
MENENSGRNEVMNGDEAAIFLKMPKSTLLKLCSEGQLPGAIKVGRQWRFQRNALEKWNNDRNAVDSEDLESVGEPVEIPFPPIAEKPAKKTPKETKPIVEKVIGSVGDFDFETTGDVRELDEDEVQSLRQADSATSSKPSKKTTPSRRNTSALDLMAEISDKTQPRRPGRPPRSKPVTPEPVRTKPAFQAKTAPAFRDTATETFPDIKGDDDAVEISRPYTKPPINSNFEPNKKKSSNNNSSVLKKAAYAVIIIGVVGLAGIGVKSMLVPPVTNTSSLDGLSQTPTATPTLPEFQVVYKHNEPDEAEPKNLSPSVSKPPVTSQPLLPSEPAHTTPPSVTATLAKESAPTAPVSISSIPPVDKGLEAINKLLPTLFNLSGCTINSTNNEIRITFQEGIFSSGLKIEGPARERLARIAELLSTNAPDFWLIIEGQTDGSVVRKQSPYRDNYTLGLRRAVEANEVMRNDGKFPADRLLSSSAGGMAPPFPITEPGSAAKNRTVILRLIPKVSGPAIPSQQ